MIPFDEEIGATLAAIHSSSPDLSKLFWTASLRETSSPASDYLFAVRSRFPFSFLPLLTLLVSSLHPNTKEIIFNNFQSLPTYTQTLQRGFTGYDIIEEERDNTLITLRNELRVFPERDDGEGAIVVQTGTVGRLLSRGESVPTVMWEWSFNGWALVGRVLESALTSGLTSVIAADDSYVPIILNIFRLLEGVMTGSTPDIVESVVTATSEDMAQEWDVISVTYELVAQALEILDVGTHTRAQLEQLLAISERGIRVLTAAVSGREASIWSLVVKGGAKWWGRISRIGITAEVPHTNRVTDNRCPRRSYVCLSQRLQLILWMLYFPPQSLML
jgi:Nucleoporin subcomplex protein binding to Pom34